jgi:hypothetical protein
MENGWLTVNSTAELKLAAGFKKCQRTGFHQSGVHRALVEASAFVVIVAP